MQINWLYEWQQTMHSWVLISPCSANGVEMTTKQKQKPLLSKMLTFQLGGNPESHCVAAVLVSDQDLGDPGSSSYSATDASWVTSD